MKNAVMPLEDYDAFCDKLRELSGTEDLIKSGEMPEKISEVYEAGQTAEYDRFWDAYQENGNRTSYGYAFQKGFWNDETFKPKYDIVPEGECPMTFFNSSLTNIEDSLKKAGVKLDTSKITLLNGTFQMVQTTNLPPIDLSSCTGIQLGFYNMEKLKSLTINNLREDCTFNRAINYCYKLETLNITGTIGQNGFAVTNTTNLTHDSLMNIIGCLKDFREETTFTVDVPTYTPAAITNGTLEEGKEYTWCYYDSMYPGWIRGDDATVPPSDEEVWITSTVGKVTVNETEYVGFKANWLNYPTQEDAPFGAYVYQDGSEIKVYAEVPGSEDKINLILKEAPITKTITLGTTNLNKLTDAEKATATEKGWSLV